MTDIALAWNPDYSAADMALGGGMLAGDDGMRTAILISLFSDARAPVGADLPEHGDDRRGWWGDAFAAPNQFSGAGNARDADALGSALWLLRRAKSLPAVVEQARLAAIAALGWLVRDGVARTVEVTAEALTSAGLRSMLAIGVTIDRPEGPGRQRFDFTWDASTGEVNLS